MSQVRMMSNKMLEALEEGALDPIETIKMFLSYMSEDDVADMCHVNELFYEEEEEEEEDFTDEELEILRRYINGPVA